MKKLESMSGDMFTPFKENEFTNLVKCTGGAIVSSTWTQGDISGTDTVENTTMNCTPKADIITQEITKCED